MVRLFIAALVLVVVSICDAFCLPKKVSFVVSGGKSVVRLCAAADEPEWETKEQPYVAAEEEEEQQPDVVVDDETEPDPEMVALKQEIVNLESTLKAKQRELSYHEEQLDHYSKAGYARKVAEMETMRRRRSRMNSSSKETAMASVVQNFLPILEELEYLGETYGNDDFGKSYAALAGTLKSGMKELGVEEYSVGIGEKVDTSRALVVEEEYSQVFNKGIVIRPISNGMELQGNVMKMAECVVSLGKEEELSNDEDETEQEQEMEAEE